MKTEIVCQQLSLTQNTLLHLFHISVYYIWKTLSGPTYTFSANAKVWEERRKQENNYGFRCCIKVTWLSIYSTVYRNFYYLCKYFVTSLWLYIDGMFCLKSFWLLCSVVLRLLLVDLCTVAQCGQWSAKTLVSVDIVPFSQKI